MVARLAKSGRRLSFCYEAGPCGYGLHRLLTGSGHECVVVAPSLIPIKAGDRVKTDRRDARMLAKLHRAGELTALWVPDGGHEMMRDLIRARATAVRVLGKARQHLQGFLLRHERVYREAAAARAQTPTARSSVGRSRRRRAAMATSSTRSANSARFSARISVMRCSIVPGQR